VSLNDWLKAQWVKEHKSSRQEIANLLGVADRDLKDCEAKGLSDDGRLAIAYNAALQCAVAALMASGYQPSRDAPFSGHPKFGAHDWRGYQADREVRCISQEAEPRRL
jgi:hypothetical protein